MPTSENDWIDKLLNCGFRFHQMSILRYHHNYRGLDPEIPHDDDETMVVDAKFCGQIKRIRQERHRIIVTFKWLAEWKKEKYWWQMVEPEHRRFEFIVDRTHEPEYLPYGRVGLETWFKEGLKKQQFHLTFWPEINLAKADIEH